MLLEVQIQRPYRVGLYLYEVHPPMCKYEI